MICESGLDAVSQTQDGADLKKNALLQTAASSIFMSL
jgi:hypothetical protein